MLNELLKKLYSAIISSDKKQEEKTRKQLEKIGCDRITQNILLKELFKK